jgi:hypothetical protein
MLKYSSSYLSGSPDYDLGHQSRLFGANAEDEAKIHSIQEIGKLQLELNQNAHLLTDEEKK